MGEETISIRTRQAFRESMVSNWVLRQIRDAFDAAEIDCNLAFAPNVSGDRRTLIEQYYQTLDLTNKSHARRLVRVFEAVIERLEEMSTGIGESANNPARTELDKLVRFLKKDGFEWVGGKIVTETGTPYLSDIKKAVFVFDAKHLGDQIRRMENSVDSDPTLAIGTAKEMIETVCKTILAERGKPVAGSPDVSTLTKETLKELRLVPEGISQEARGADVIKRLLSNLGTIGNGLAELRGLYGTGHGQHGAATGLEARHARLAVGSAATLSTFLFETHQATMKKERA